MTRDLFPAVVPCTQKIPGRRHNAWRRHWALWHVLSVFGFLGQTLLSLESSAIYGQ